MKFKPILDFILVSDIETKQPYSDKIIIPGTAKQKLYLGTVQAVGPGSRYKGKTIPMTLKVGDRVIFGKGVGVEAEISEKKGLIMKTGDIFGIWTGYNE